MVRCALCRGLRYVDVICTHEHQEGIQRRCVQLVDVPVEHTPVSGFAEKTIELFRLIHIGNCLTRRRTRAEFYGCHFLDGTKQRRDIGGKQEAGISARRCIADTDRSPIATIIQG